MRGRDTQRHYAELQLTTNFSFLRGASHPHELVGEAADLGLAGVGVTDRNTLAGVVRVWTAAKSHEAFQMRVGCRLDFIDSHPSVLCYPTDREAYGRLTRLLTRGKTRERRGRKTSACEIAGRDLYEFAEGQVLIVVPPATLDDVFLRDLTALASDFRGFVYLAGSRGYGARDHQRLHRLAEIAREASAPLVATNDVLYHAPERRPLQDVMSCVREKTTIQQAGLILEANAERHLKSPQEMARLFRDHPDALDRTLEILERCRFRLDDLRYEYPHEPVPPGKTAMQHLRDLCAEGVKQRYPNGVPEKAITLLEQEYALIEELDYPHFFLTVRDAVHFARGKGILCQGRGSAANSMVCYCLHVTAIDPLMHNLLFARFLSKERNEPPDIDVDFEHERREEVIQEMYRRYGRDRAAICATVIRYRPRSAIRDVGKALGLSTDITARLADTVWGSWGDGLPDEHIRQAGLDPENPEILRAADLATQLLGFPRHLSQHVGGFVLTERRLDETVPIGNAAMADRTFLEWDKDDIEDLKMLKVDILALGMLTCLKRGIDMLNADENFPLHIGDLADIPPEQPEVYDMLCEADSIGVFQIESRAQMSMLPRLRPREFYDLVIEVAIVRPGPIQGDMVHPYLRRRDGIDPVVFDHPSPEYGPADELKEVLGRTLGVPLFQEQAMKLAITAAGFNADQANGLRRAMATFKHDGDVSVYRDKFVGGMVGRGYQLDFAERCFKQIEGFGSYGFPESHAASFAKLVYASSWIKKWRPDVFCCAILNSQPMGFYQPAQLVRDAREHDVEIRGVDVLLSDYDCSLERADATSVMMEYGRYKAVRLGFRQVRGMDEQNARLLVEARANGARTPEALARAGVTRRTIELIAQADGFRSLGLSRREALWTVKGLDFSQPAKAAKSNAAPLLALMGDPVEAKVDLPGMKLPSEVAEDYRTHGLSLKAHPCRFFRKSLAARGAVPAATLKDKKIRQGRSLTVAGLVLIRQRPGTAKGVVFVTLEDETGPCNVVVWPDRFEAHRKLVMTSAFLLVRGKIQRDAKGGVVHLVAESFEDLSPALGLLREQRSVRAALPEPVPDLVRSRDFH
ncbi:MAG TPA: error-prone DNA polymerase [Caulobacteraceae bacterium]|jgi:error-prone DNA polymerase|nr:error-prone DNA polymerase [Caulobacteraceae bacterium]